MIKQITSAAVVAYHQCPVKAYLLLVEKQPGQPHEYETILGEQKATNERDCIERLHSGCFAGDVCGAISTGTGPERLTNVALSTDQFLAQCALLTKPRARPLAATGAYEPTLFTGTCRVSVEQRLELAFIGHTLGKIQGAPPERGKIVDASGNAHVIHLKPLAKQLSAIISVLQEWLSTPLPEPPPLVLNRHCDQCQYRHLCRPKAQAEDNLSLLSGVTSRMMAGYGKKGIFTVKQLSYLFKLRRPSKRAKSGPPRPKPELRALAIRTGRVYLQQTPTLARSETELYLDLEGVPDRRRYYLAGLLISERGVCTHQSFWADDDRDEEQMWQRLLEQIEQYPEAPIYHYGEYDAKALAELTQRYETTSRDIMARLVNVVNHVYGRVYFPVYSNSLKEIANFLGFHWSHSDASGLQSLVWRYRWEETRDPHYQELLTDYNREDCLALRLLVGKLAEIGDAAADLPTVDFVNNPKRHSTETGQEVHQQFRSILDFAHAAYDRRKIRLFPDRDADAVAPKPKSHGFKKGYEGQRQRKPRASKVVHLDPGTVCPRDGSALLQTDRTSKRLIIDLVPWKAGIRKTVTEYVGKQGYCPTCGGHYPPPGLWEYHKNQLYDHGFRAWVVYQKVALRMTNAAIGETLAEQFGEKEPRWYIAPMVKQMSRYYAETEEIITEGLLASPFIHVDETAVNVGGNTQYVWTFATDKHVKFKLSRTREASLVHELLGGYRGVLISDFYGGYDAVQCRQQKCWVHLIREMNEDLWDAPYDAELELVVSQVRNLMVPIMRSVEKHGLKDRYLRRFKGSVEDFYESTIVGKDYKSELATKYQKRFVRYRESLFTFLEEDGIPWHNNTAERALRHVAKQQQVSQQFFEGVTPDYLRLLGIRQSLRFQGKSFFRFLFSKQTDIRSFR
jgi:predicted RecB family nuclease